MKLIPKYYNDLPDHPDAPGEYGSHVVVEWTKAHGSLLKSEEIRYIKCYIPAHAWKEKDGSVLIRYESHHKGYDPYFVYEKHIEETLPKMYEFTSIGVRECLLLSIGVLLGYDENEDCFKPFLDYVDDKGENVYLKWRDIPQLKDNWRIWSWYLDKKNP